MKQFELYIDGDISSLMFFVVIPENWEQISLKLVLEVYIIYSPNQSIGFLYTFCGNLGWRNLIIQFNM